MTHWLDNARVRPCLWHLYIYIHIFYYLQLNSDYKFSVADVGYTALKIIMNEFYLISWKFMETNVRLLLASNFYLLLLIIFIINYCILI